MSPSNSSGRYSQCSEEGQVFLKDLFMSAPGGVQVSESGPGVHKGLHTASVPSMHLLGPWDSLPHPDPAQWMTIEERSDVQTDAKARSAARQRAVVYHDLASLIVDTHAAFRATEGTDVDLAHLGDRADSAGEIMTALEPLVTTDPEQCPSADDLLDLPSLPKGTSLSVFHTFVKVLQDSLFKDSTLLTALFPDGTAGSSSATDVSSGPGGEATRQILSDAFYAHLLNKQPTKP